MGVHSAEANSVKAAWSRPAPLGSLKRGLRQGASQTPALKRIPDANIAAYDYSNEIILLVIISTTLISCSVFPVGSQQQVTPTVYPTTFSPTPRPLVTITSTPSITLTVPSIIPSQANNPVCIASTSTTESDGWDCLNESYGFTVHFPSNAGIARTTNDVVDVWLENSPTNPRIDRLIEIVSEEKAESCFSESAEKMLIGEHDFTVKNGFEPSGVVYAWRSYAISKGPKSVCFVFVVSFRERNQDDPPFPPEENQGLDDVEAILTTFHWLEP